LFIIIIPWLGVLCYLLVRGKDMQMRNLDSLAHSEDMRRANIKEVAGSSLADELSKFAELKNQGILTDAEFETQKARLLS
jgi:hypothetical protein